MEKLLSHLNSLRPTIQFTVEIEKDGSLPFLDILLRQKDDGSLDTMVYRKPTHTNHYLNFHSHHPHHVKRGLVRCLHDRARNITSSQENLNREERHIATVLNITATLMASSTPPPSHNPPRTLSIEKRNKRALTCSDPHW